MLFIKAFFYEAHVIIVLMWPELYQAQCNKKYVHPSMGPIFYYLRIFFLQSTKDKVFTRNLISLTIYCFENFLKAPGIFEGRGPYCVVHNSQALVHAI